MEKEKLINEFIIEFRKQAKEQGLDVPELSDNDIKSMLMSYFDSKSLTKAEKFLYNEFDNYVKDTYNDIDWSVDREAVKETEAYKNWVRHNDISQIMCNCRWKFNLMEHWVEYNGKAHNDEEAAKIAADKWCELLFQWHLQDNGALNETHGGGFPACALATILANDSKENITEDMKVKAHELFYQYYLRMIHYGKTFDDADIKWLKENLKPDDDFDWERYGFRLDMYCDYDPSYPLYIILLNAGLGESDIRNICPWKTGISIRREDNTVMYNTYQHCDEL